MNQQTKEALKMALEAMDCYDYTGYRSESELYAKAIQACKEALAQPTQYSDIISDGGYDPRNKLAKPIQDAIDFLDGSYEAHKIRKALQEALAQPEEEAQQEYFAHKIYAKNKDVCNFKSTVVKKGDMVYIKPPQLKRLSDADVIEELERLDTYTGKSFFAGVRWAEEEFAKQNGMELTDEH